jgi:hypothetical protein
MANKIYINPETIIEWLNTGGDLDMDLGGLAADGVQMGAYHDQGAGVRAHRWGFELLIDGFDTAPEVGKAIHLFISQSIATTNFDGNPTTDPTDTAEGTMTVDQLKNCLPSDSAIVYSTTAGDELKVTGEVIITSRYFSPCIHNDTADALLSTADAHSLKMWPLPDEIQ